MPVSKQRMKEAEDEDVPDDNNSSSNINDDVKVNIPSNATVDTEQSPPRVAAATTAAAASVTATAGSRTPAGAGNCTDTNGVATELNTGGDMNSSSGSGTTSRSSSKPGGYSADCSSLSNFSEDTASDGTGGSGKSPTTDGDVDQKSPCRKFKSKKKAAEENESRNKNNDPSCSTPEKQGEKKVTRGDQDRDRGDEDDGKSLSSDGSRHSNSNTVDLDMRMITRPNQQLSSQLNDDARRRRDLHQAFHDANERSKTQDTQSPDQNARRTSNLPKQNQGQLNNGRLTSKVDQRINVRSVKMVTTRNNDKHSNNMNDSSMNSNMPFVPDQNNDDKNSSAFGIRKDEDIFTASFPQLLASCKPFFSAFPNINRTTTLVTSTTATSQQKVDKRGLTSSVVHQPARKLQSPSAGEQPQSRNVSSPLPKANKTNADDTDEQPARKLQSPSAGEEPQSRNISSPLSQINKTHADDTDELSMVVHARPRHKREKGDSDNKNNIILPIPRASSSNNTSSSSSLTSKRGNDAIVHNRANVNNADIVADVMHIMNQQLRREYQRHQQQPQNNRQQDGSTGPNESSSSARTSHVVTGSGAGSGTGSGIGSGTGSGNNLSPYKNGEVLIGGGDAKIPINKSDAMGMRDYQNSQCIQVRPNSNGDANKMVKSDEDRKSTQERLALKKRKRMDKRREYEKEVKRQAQSSSDDSSVEKIFPPGTHVSMEECLTFTKTAR